MTLDDLFKRLKAIGWTVKANAAGDEYEVKEPEQAPPVEVPKKDEEPVKNEGGEWTAEEAIAVKELIAMLPALKQALGQVPEAVQMAQKIKANEQSAREALINSITSSPANVYTNEELASMSMPTLEKVNAQVHVNYSGAAGGQVFENVAAPLTRRAVILSPVEKN